MPQLLFQVAGLTRSRSRRRWRRALRPSRAAAVGTAVSAWAWLAIGGMVVYGVGSLVPDMATALFGKPLRHAEIGGTDFYANVLYVVRDDSTSMQGTEQQLETQIETLERSGMKVDRMTVTGFGVKEGRDDNLLHAIEESLLAKPKPDAIYAFSDFIRFDEEGEVLAYWASDDAGWTELERLLETHRVRLYLGTVESEPVSRLEEVARESGGGLVDMKPPNTETP